MEIDFDDISDEFDGQGQKSRSPAWKAWFSDFQMGWPVQIHFVLSYDITWRYGMTLWRHVTAGMMSFEVFGQENRQGGHGPDGRINAQVFS